MLRSDQRDVGGDFPRCWLSLIRSYTETNFVEYSNRLSQSMQNVSDSKQNQDP